VTTSSPRDPLITSLRGFDINAAFIQFFIHIEPGDVCVWILEISTIVFIVYSFEYFLAEMFPIDIMPSAVQAVMKWLPFTTNCFVRSRSFSPAQGAELMQARAIPTGWCLSRGCGPASCGDAASALQRLAGRTKTRSASDLTSNVQRSTLNSPLLRWTWMLALNVGRFHPNSTQPWRDFTSIRAVHSGC